MTHEAFLEAILDSPEDDAPRLVFADWLEDHGQPERAELIRLQCRLTDDLPAAERAGLTARQDELIERHRRAWLGPVAEQAYEVTFQRGVACPRLQPIKLLSRKLQPAWAEWFARGLVLELHLAGSTRKRDELLALPQLGRIYRLVLDDPQQGDEEVEQLARCPQLSRLTSLALRGSTGTAYVRRFSKAAVQALSASPHLQRLRALDFTLHPLTPDALTLLTSRRHWPALTSLEIGWTKLGGPLLRGLLEAPWLEDLTRLGLYSCLSSDASVSELVRSPRLGRLRHLNLGSNNVGDGAAYALAMSPHLAGLRRLSLRFARISEAGARALAQSPFLNRLSHLDLYSMTEDDPRTRLLRDRFGAALRVDYTKPI